MYGKILTELFYHKYNYLVDKIYSYKNNTILFLKNGKIKSTGYKVKRMYKFINKLLIICYLEGKEYLFKFNVDYSRFISVRKHDLEIGFGYQL